MLPFAMLFSYVHLSRILFLLILSAGLATYPAVSGCGLNYCPRPSLSLKESPSVAWSLEHTKLGRDTSRTYFTQSLFHLRLPLGQHWILGSHLPFGYLQTSATDQWGLANPLVYAERISRPTAKQALTWGMQLELPFGDDKSGIAAGHTMILPYFSYAMRGNRTVALASVGFSAQLPDGHSHGHAGDAVSDPARVEVNPHEPYEFLYRFSLAVPLKHLRLEPEFSLSGARVLFPEGAATDFVSGEAALGLQVAQAIVLKPRWKQHFTHPGRFAWSTGLDVKFDIPLY